MNLTNLTDEELLLETEKQLTMAIYTASGAHDLDAMTCMSEWNRRNKSHMYDVAYENVGNKIKR